MIDEFDPVDERPKPIRRFSPVLLLVPTLAVIAALGLFASRPPLPSMPLASPPPAEIAGDPLLVHGREVFLDRCVSCHGKSGRGDGPIAKGLPGPPVGNLTDATWKHGDSPEQVLGVLRNGVRETQMPAWGSLLKAEDIRAAAAYVYELAGRPVPEAIRGR